MTLICIFLGCNYWHAKSSKVSGNFAFQMLAQVIDTIIAGILHDVIDDTDRDHQSVRLHFGDDVSKLVAGVSKLSNINQVYP